MNDRLQKVSRHDHRLQTAIALLDRHGMIQGPRPPECFAINRNESEVEALLERHFGEPALADKKQRDQRRLLSLVELARCTEDRKQFLESYFS